MNCYADLHLEHSYSDLSENFFTRIKPAPVSSPKILIFNKELAEFMGIDPLFEGKDMLVKIFSGNALPGTTIPIAMELLDFSRMIGLSRTV